MPTPLRTPLAAPLKTALALLVLGVLLLGWHQWKNPTQGMDTEIFADTFRTNIPHPPTKIATHVPTTAPTHASGKLPTTSPFFVDSSGELNSFYATLWQLEKKSDSGIVTILHYGDSPTTADLITGDVRATLQTRFGDAGRGYTLIAKPWPWYGHRGIEILAHNWKIRTGVGSMHEGIYGLGGASFEGQPGASSTFHLIDADQRSVEIEYLARPRGGSFTVTADDRLLATQTTDSEAAQVMRLHVDLAPGTKFVCIKPASGPVMLFGADFHRGPGVLYDSLGLNGATTTVLARTQPPTLWKQELADASPSLIIVNYGSNESSFKSFVHKYYANELRTAIERIRTAAPGVPILIMSPMDRGERSGLNQIDTMSTIPEIVAIQRTVAAEMHCAFFDTYDAMGGEGTMSRWYEASPRLVTADLLHPMPQGASIVASLFIEQLSLGYDRWKMQHGIVLTTAPARTAKEKTLPTAHIHRLHTASSVQIESGKQ